MPGALLDVFDVVEGLGCDHEREMLGGKEDGRKKRPAAQAGKRIERRRAAPGKLTPRPPRAT
jgi:hypothetical protein